MPSQLEKDVYQGKPARAFLPLYNVNTAARKSKESAAPYTSGSKRD